MSARFDGPTLTHGETGESPGMDTLGIAVHQARTAKQSRWEGALKNFAAIANKLSETVIFRLAGLIPSLSFVAERQERVYAERESAMMLDLYRDVRSAHAELCGKKLYEKIVAHRLGCDETEAIEIVRHADESYARWPDVRDLTFRDVVHYVIVHHLLSAHTGSVGTQANTEQTVKAAIPCEL